MSFRRYFSDGFEQARTKFLAAAEKQTKVHETFENPLKGPHGELLATDVALVGPTDAKQLLVVVSGTHGVEFLGGSGCQTGWLEAFHPSQLPADTAVLMIHAVNPYGAAWMRRFNEDNIDLNRNFVDHSKPHFENPYYGEIHDFLIPPELDGPKWQEAADQIKDFRQTKGERAYQVACLGQYSHPDGFYYGGQQPAWSNLTLRKIINMHCRSRQHVVVLDLHTGLGPFGYGMVGILAEPGTQAAKRAYGWYGRAATTFAEAGQQTGFPDYARFQEGFLLQAFNQELSETRLTLGGIEFGTFPLDVVTSAEIADVWLFNHPDAPQDVAAKIRSEMLRVYYPNTCDWQEMVWWRFNQVLNQALQGLDDCD